MSDTEINPNIHPADIILIKGIEKEKILYDSTSQEGCKYAAILEFKTLAYKRISKKLLKKLDLDIYIWVISGQLSKVKILYPLNPG